MKQLFAATLVDLMLAFRSVRRQKRRAGFALLIIVAGVVALLLAGGFIQWVLDTMRESAIYSQLGHIQVVRPDYHQKGISDPYKYLLPEGSAVETRIRELPSVEAVTPRLSFVGMISLGEATLSFMGEGVDPVGEMHFAKYFLVDQGERLSADDPDGIVIGQGLAANLGAKVGDKVVLMTTTARGGLNAHDAHIRGIFYTSAKSYDDGAIQLPISLARQLVKIKGATSWLLVLDGTDKTDKTLARLRETLDPKAFQLVPWYDLADFYNKTVALFKRQVMVVKLLIGMIIVLSISNTLSMAVIERTNEIGTAMALGVRRQGILRLFIFEGMFLGVLGGMVGVLLGWVLSLIISAIGIPMPPPPGMSNAFTGQITVNGGMALDALAVAVVTTLLASIVPAWKASRMIIVDALRHQR